jgi:hypothetical protein
MFRSLPKRLSILNFEAIMRSLLIIALIYICFAARAQMVNIEGQRMHTDSVRLAGNANLSFSYSETNEVRLLMLKASEAVQLKSRNFKHLWLLLSNYELSRSADLDLTNAWFAHGRYNYKVNKWLRWEIYTQGQYNKLLGIQLRYLNGLGPRFKFLQKNAHAAYAGISYMYEYEETNESPRQFNRQHRTSNYLTITLQFKKLPTELVSTAYFQPRIGSLEDYRIMQQSSLRISITNKLRLTAGVLYLFDSEPPAGINGRSLRIEQGVRYEF